MSVENSWGYERNFVLIAVYSFKWNFETYANVDLLR